MFLPSVACAENAHHIIPATTGYICDLAYINGWTIYTGRTWSDKVGSYNWGIWGLADSAEEPVMLYWGQTVGIVPCGDSFVYVGEDANGKQRRFVLKPGEEPKVLPLTWKQDVFYGSESSVWYTEGGKIHSIGLNGKNKRRLGSVQGKIEGALSDSSIVIANYDSNTISVWKDGKLTVLYTFPDNKFGVMPVNDSIWLRRSGHFGRLVNGELRDCWAGYTSAEARTAHQLVFLVRDQIGADEARVLLIDDLTRSYAWLGRVPYNNGFVSQWIELHRDHVVYYNGLDERHVLAIPTDESAWTAYEN